MENDRKYLEESDSNLHIRQNILLRAFLINFILVLICWLLSFSSDFMSLCADMINVPIDRLDIYFINWLAVWDIAGVVLFLVPGLATYWARFALKKMF